MTEPSKDPDFAPQPTGQEHFHEGEEEPPPGVRAMAIVRWLLFAAMAIAALASVWSWAAPREGASAHAPKYFCPMHPQITSEVPGECPICHMSLEPIPEGRGAKAPAAPSTEPPRHAHPHPSAAPAASGTAPPAEATKPFYCPMHPEIESDDPGARCPKCGMKLEPRAAPPPQTTPITLALDRIQAIGVRTALVERAAAGGALRVTAEVAAPDRGLAAVHARAPGYVEAIRVRELGVRVKAGELLVSIYSPEIFRAEQELLALAGWTGTQARDGGLPPPPLEAAKKRLELLGLGGAAVDRILATGKPVRAVGVPAPIGGHIVRKNVVLGSYVTPEMTLFEIADLGKVYVIAKLYPHQAATVRIGDEASFSTPSLAGRSFRAKIDLVYPDVDRTTRAVRARFQVENTDLALLPGTFGTAEIAGRAWAALTVPLDAVIDTGRHRYVFVAEEGGRFSPRTVDIAGEEGDRFVVAGGLVEGERVVSGATFLIDAESRLRASLAGASAHAHTP